MLQQNYLKKYKYLMQVYWIFVLEKSFFLVIHEIYINKIYFIKQIIKKLYTHYIIF